MSDLLIFDRYSIDPNTFELRCDDEPVPVEPLVLDLIIEMVRNPSKLYTRDDLIETVWDGRIVSDTTISTAIKTARKALGDTGAQQRLIRTIRGRGFQFVGTVSRGAVTTPKVLSNMVSRPILRVSVFALDAAITSVMARTVESRLRAVLNRIPFVQIAAPVSMKRPESRQPSVTYDLEVALSLVENTCHADVTLSAVDEGIQKWARSFAVADNPSAETLVASITAYAEPELLNELAEYFGNADQSAPNAKVLRAMQVLSERGWNPEPIKAATKLLETAIGEDGNNPLAFAIVSLLKAIGFRVGMVPHDAAMTEKAIQQAEQALALESRNSVVLGMAGCALCDLGQLARGEPIIDRALDLDPTNGHAHAAKGAAMMMRGDVVGALKPLRRSIAISSADNRLAVWGAILAMAELRCKEIENALMSAEIAVSRDDHNYLPRLALAAIQVARGDEDGADRAILELLRVHPKINASELSQFVGQRLQSALWPKIESARA